MSPGDKFSRRALLRKSLGIRLQQEEQKEPLFPDLTPAEIPLNPATSEQVLARIAAEPAYRLMLPKLLDFCLAPRSGSEIHDWMLNFPEMRTALHSPELLLSWMVQAGGIVAYAADEQTPDMWETTDAGKAALDANDPLNRMQRLLNSEHVYADIYRQILEFCLTARSSLEIEDLLRAHPALEDPKIYPSYLIDRLEIAGGLEWIGKWTTTEAGKQSL